MSIFDFLSCGRSPTGAWRDRLRLGLLLFLVLTGLPRPAAATIFYYPEDLDVQETLAHDCEGRIVSPEEAEVIKQRRQGAFLVIPIGAGRRCVPSTHRAGSCISGPDPSAFLSFCSRVKSTRATAADRC